MITNIDPMKCTGCGLCVEICPLDTLRLDPFQEEIAPCQGACPAHVDIRGYVYYLKQEMLDEAINSLAQCLPFPAITGHICYHPCESKCARKEVDEPVNINLLECYVGDQLLKAQAVRLPITHAAKVAVVGSGPAGLSVAYFLMRKGYEVTVFESSSDIGGMLRREVSKKKLPQDILDMQINHIKNMGIAFETRTTFGKSVNLNDLWDDRYRAVFLATGFESRNVTPLPNEIPTNDKGTVVVDPVTFGADQKGVFAGGGMIMNRAPIVKVIAAAKRAASSIDRYLQGKDLKKDKEKGAKPVKNLPKQGVTRKTRQENSAGFTEEMAAKEAQRCMSCGGKAYIAHPEDCMTCYECEVNCPSGAIEVHPFKEQVTLTLPLP